MSGHNRWSKVKRIKGPVDAKRGKLFTKLIREIMVAAKAGGGNVDGNARLRHAVALARAASMPKENIERAIKKGTGELEGSAYEEVMYEGYGPGGVAVLVQAMTDNKNRTVSDLRVLFRVAGGSLGEQGSVAWMFEQCGQLLFEAEKVKEDTVMEVALEAGAKDVSSSHGMIEVVTDVPDLFKVRESFERVGMHPASAGYAYVPKSTVPVDKSMGEKVLKLLEEIEDHDDIQHVHSNFEMDEAELAALTRV